MQLMDCWSEVGLKSKADNTEMNRNLPQLVVEKMHSEMYKGVNCRH